MFKHLGTDMPEHFDKRVHRALRAWHARHIEDVLTDLFLADRIRTEREGAMPRLISNQILMNGLDRLKQTDGEATELLQRRFLNRETALEVAYSRNLSEDVVFQRQRAAITQLARVIWSQEIELCQQRIRQIEARLEPPSYRRLFGVTDKMAELRTQLDAASEPWLIAIDGLGGIGKTSLADALVRELACRVRFHEIGWVSARVRLFRLSGGIETLSDRTELTLGELVDRLIDQFGLAGLRRRSDAEKLAGLKDFLRSQPCLIVIDNLETATDYRSLVSRLGELVNPTKFLITTRHSLRNTSGVYSMTLRQLSRGDALALIRHEAETRGMQELANAAETDLAQIYDVTGGNPLAIKLIIGQIHTLSLPVALSRFSGAKGRSVEELLTFVYTNTWQILNQNCRRVLQAMLLVTEGGGRLEQIAAAAELDTDDTANCLHRLVGLSLVNVGGDLRIRRYSLHQLTQIFVAQQSTEDDLPGKR